MAGMPDVYAVILKNGFARTWIEDYVAEKGQVLEFDHDDTEGYGEDELPIYAIVERKVMVGKSVPEIVDELCNAVHQLNAEVGRLSRIISKADRT